MSPPEPSLYSTASAYCCALLSAGWTSIGQGVAGQVFHREGCAEAIKVSDGDPCYLAFADYAAKYPSQCLPKLQVVYRNGQWAVTHIELLRPLDSKDADEVKAWWDLYIAAKKSGCTPPPPAGWSALADALGPIACREGCRFDMKCENAMQRNGVVVFIDPLN